MYIYIYAHMCIHIFMHMCRSCILYCKKLAILWSLLVTNSNDIRDFFPREDLYFSCIEGTGRDRFISFSLYVIYNYYKL